MILNTKQTALSAAYCALLSWIYLREISIHWQYMGFNGEYSFNALLISFGLVALISAAIPNQADTRASIIATMNYIFFIPAIVYMAYSPVSMTHYVAFGILVFSIFFFSAIPIEPFTLTPLSPKNILVIVFGAILIAIGVQAAFGGLRNFNLDIERVYEFRREAAEELPAIFGYVYSNVSSALVPLALVLSFTFRRYWLIGLALLSSVILFGMSHHKSVVFAPPSIVLLYLFFSRMRSTALIGWVFMAVPIVCILERLYLWTIVGSSEAAYINSLIIRRVLFTPPLLDSLFIEYFSANAKYYWSASTIGSWLSSNQYGISAPFLIGYEYFADTDMSANTGVIGSGFSNAGLLGVALYSAGVGLLIALFNAYGRRIGHAFVTAASLVTIFNVVTTTDLLTAILTHGLLLLILLLALFPVQAETRQPLGVRFA